LLLERYLHASTELTVGPFSDFVPEADLPSDRFTGKHDADHRIVLKIVWPSTMKDLKILINAKPLHPGGYLIRLALQIAGLDLKSLRMRPVIGILRRHPSARCMLQSDVPNPRGSPIFSTSDALHS